MDDPHNQLLLSRDNAMIGNEQQNLKITENRVRRAAQRQGLKLKKSRRRDRRAHDFPRYMIVAANNGAPVIGHKPNAFSASLEDIQLYLGLDLGKERMYQSFTLEQLELLQQGKFRVAMGRVRAASALPKLDLETARDLLCGRGINSHQRLQAMLELVERRSAEEGMPIVLENWTGCDATGAGIDCLLFCLSVWKAQGHRHDGYLSVEAREFFDDLSDEVTVYRGGDASKHIGAAWSTDRDVALGFARGHRGIRNPDPIITAATVSKEDILAVFVDREESEVLIDPTDAFNIRVTRVQKEISKPGE